MIESAWGGGNLFAFWALVIAALFTSFYSWRLMFLTFFGEPRGDRHTHEHAHESPMVMVAPLGVLALGAVFAGMVWYGPFFGESEKVARFFSISAAEAHAEGAEEHAEAGENPAAAGEHDEEAGGEAEGEGVAAAADEAAEGDAEGVAEALTATGEDDPDSERHHFAFGGAPGDGAIYIGPDNHVIDAAHESPIWVKVSPFIAMLLGFGLAWLAYIRQPSLPKTWAENQAPLHRFLFNKWYFDEIFGWAFVRPASAIGRFFWRRGDGNVIDGSINGVAMGFIPFMTRAANRMQSGYLFHYAFAMVIGIALILTWLTLTGGAN